MTSDIQWRSWYVSLMEKVGLSLLEQKKDIRKEKTKEI
jgi:hypothetical protein